MSLNSVTNQTALRNYLCRPSSNKRLNNKSNVTVNWQGSHVKVGRYAPPSELSVPTQCLLNLLNNQDGEKANSELADISDMLVTWVTAEMASLSRACVSGTIGDSSSIADGGDINDTLDFCNLWQRCIWWQKQQCDWNQWQLSGRIVFVIFVVIIIIQGVFSLGLPLKSMENLG